MHSGPTAARIDSLEAHEFSAHINAVEKCSFPGCGEDAIVIRSFVCVNWQNVPLKGTWSSSMLLNESWELGFGVHL